MEIARFAGDHYGIGNPLFSSKRALENKKFNKPCKLKTKALRQFTLFWLNWLFYFAFVVCHLSLRHNMLGAPCTTRFVLVGILLDQVALLVKNNSHSFFPFDLEAATTLYDITLAKKLIFCFSAYRT